MSEYADIKEILGVGSMQEALDRIAQDKGVQRGRLRSVKVTLTYTQEVVVYAASDDEAREAARRAIGEGERTMGAPMETYGDVRAVESVDDLPDSYHGRGIMPWTTDDREGEIKDLTVYEILDHDVSGSGAA